MASKSSTARRRWITLACTGLLVAGAITAGSLGALADEAEVPAGTGDVNSPATYTEGVPQTDPLHPIVYQLEDGTLIQRTPDENQYTPDYQQPRIFVPSNTYFVDADAKGCNACHEDLAATVSEMGVYRHYDLRSKIGTSMTVDQCQDCHALRGRPSQTVEGELGNLIHGIHSHGEADCWNCHVAGDNTEGNFAVWDNVKYDHLRGITDIDAESISTDFSYRQDEIFDADQDFILTWEYNPGMEERADAIQNNVPVDESLFDTWTVTISGMVDNEITWTLPELIEQAGSQKHVFKHLCAHNPVNGPFVFQGEYTGVDLKWVLEQAGVQEGATSIRFVATDGSGVNVSVADALDPEICSMLVYELNGERLSRISGYPLASMTGQRGANDEGREIVEIIVSDRAEDPEEQHGNHWYTKPNIGIMNAQDGLIIKAGEPFTFHGYIDSYNQDIEAMEISMDRGKTWQRFDFDELDKERLTTWDYTFTPEEAGAYTIYLRGIKTFHGSEESTTDHILKMMVVAKDEVPQA